MATLINNAGVQHYANKMVLAENRKVGSKSLPTALSDIDNLIDEMKTSFDAEYGSALDMKLNNNENIFSVGTGIDIDKRSEVENSFTDVELSGNSLVNLVSSEVKSMTTTRTSGWHQDRSYKYSDMIKPNTTYTIVCQVLKNTLSTPFGMGGGTKTYNQLNFNTFKNFAPKETGIKISVVQSYDEWDKTQALILFPQFGNRGEGEGLFEIGETIEYRFMIFEGDYSNNPPIDFFNGLKSVGEKEDGNHKIEILSRNKNLFNINDFEFNSVCGGVDLRIEGQEIVLNGTSTSSYTRHSFVNYLDYMKDKTTYTLSGDYMLMETTYNDGRQTWTKQITTDKSNMKKVTIYLQWLQPNTVFDNLRIRPMLEEGSVATTYVTPSLNKKEILLNEPLRGLPNGVKDTIEKINGEWKIVRRCGEYRFDETSKWVGTDVRNKGHWIRVIDSDIPNFKNRGCLITTVEVFEDTVWEDQDLDRLGVWDWSGMNFYIFIPSKLSGWDVANNVDRTTISLFMKTNAINIIHELATPTIEDISPITLQAWKNGTISIDSIIPVESTHTVALNKPAQIKRNIEELTQLRNKVKSLEEQYDQIALEQAHQLELINHSFELDYI